MVDMSEAFSKRVVYEIADMKKVVTQKNIVYGIADNQELLFDSYIPQNTASDTRLPAVILVHGEAPFHGLKDLGQYDSLGRLIAASGMVAVAFNRRTLMMGATITDVINDINNLIAYLIQNADKLNINKDKFAIWSISAGVPFGLYTGMYKNPEYIKCLVAYYGFGDFKTLMKMLNDGKLDEQTESFSLLDLLSNKPEKIPPIFIARAGMDNPQLNESLDNFIAKVLANNLYADIYNHPTGHHAFDIFDDNERTHNLLKSTLFFLKNILL